METHLITNFDTVISNREFLISSFFRFLHFLGMLVRCTNWFNLCIFLVLSVWVEHSGKEDGQDFCSGGCDSVFGLAVVGDNGGRGELEIQRP